MSFYPVIGSVDRKYPIAVYFKYDYLYIAIPLNKQSKLVTSQVYSSEGSGWFPYGDKIPVLKWLCSQIDPSVQFTQPRQVDRSKLPPLPDEPTSIYSELQDKKKKFSAKRPILDPKFYQNKDFNEIPFKIEKSLKVGNIVFYSFHNLGAFTDGVSAEYKGQFFVAFPVDKFFHAVSDELFYEPDVTYVKYPGDKKEVIQWLCKAIHPSVKFSKLKEVQIPKLPPVPDDPGSTYATLHSKVQLLRTANKMTVLPKNLYEKKELHQIPIQVGDDFPCTLR